MPSPIAPMEGQETTPAPAPATPSKRLVSIDALRGFDMLLIAGAGEFLHQLKGKTGWAWVDAAAGQFHHPAWIGFTFYDFIFPLFLVLAGVSIPFSVGKCLEQGMSKGALYRKALVRMLLLLALGILDKNAPFPFFDLPHVRLGSVLGRIGIASFVGVVLFLNLNARRRLYVVGGVLLAYYAALMLIPVPGFGAGHLTFEGNLVGWFDRTFLPGRLLQRTYDENGLLTQFPAFCLTLLGTCAGEILRSSTLAEGKKFGRLLAAGLIGIALGLLWSLHFPIVKRLWSSSFILLTGGMALVFLAAFYGVIDILKLRKWSFPFVVVGMNSLTIYLAYRFINFSYTSKLLFGGLYAPLDPKWHSVVESFGALSLVWLLVYFLYRQKIFFRV